MHRHSSSRAFFVPDPSATSASPRSDTTDRHAREGPELVEFEELYPLVVDPQVTDVLVLGGAGVWSDGSSGLRPVGGMVLREERARELGERLIALGGRHVDQATPCADVALADGIRVHVVLPPIATAGTTISVRLPRVERLGLDALEAGGFFSRIGRSVVDEAVRAHRGVLVSGATGSGKTTLLGAMLAAVAGHERIVTVEDVAELRIDHPHVVGLEARQANTEGAGAIGLDRLVREALRMRPDRIVLGECRGAEVRDLMSALNTGHAGGAGTVHANGLDDLPARLEALGLLAGLEPIALARQAASAFDVVLHVGRGGGGRRVLEAVGRLELDDHERLAVVDATPERSGRRLRRAVNGGR